MLTSLHDVLELAFRNAVAKEDERVRRKLGLLRGSHATPQEGLYEGSGSQLRLQRCQT